MVIDRNLYAWLSYIYDKDDNYITNRQILNRINFHHRNDNYFYCYLKQTFQHNVYMGTNSFLNFLKLANFVFCIFFCYFLFILNFLNYFSSFSLINWIVLLLIILGWIFNFFLVVFIEYQIFSYKMDIMNLFMILKKHNFSK
jgi:hypothetical protein